jgi:hypothetical protein
LLKDISGIFACVPVLVASREISILGKYDEAAGLITEFLHLL